MKYAYDLHIHTSLSPCADDDMTPNNIVNMAILKEIDIIAITDHNSAENLEAVCKCAEGQGILVIPGMEIETSEEVHMVCYFPSVESALKVQKVVYDALPEIKIREDIFGCQLILDENDEVKGKLEQMLVTATDLSVEDIVDIVKSAGGIAVPAHVDRDSYSIISNLGSIPDNIGFNYIEFAKNCNVEEYTFNHPRLSGYNKLISSDAHHLGDILERQSFISLDTLSISSFLEALALR
jgi:Predicted metal-dependent phosphoesterases (PHP family)